MNNRELSSKIIKSLKELKKALAEAPKSTRTEKARQVVKSAMELRETQNFLFEVVYRSCGKDTTQCIDELRYHPSGYRALWDSFSQKQVIADFERCAQKPEGSINNRPVTLVQFMKEYCDSKGYDIESKKFAIYKAAEGRLQLPRLARKWKSGQSKIFYASGLRKKWPEYCIIIPTLPPLKKQKQAEA